MTNFPPLFLVINGRFPLGLICREVPRVTERSAFLQGGGGEIQDQGMDGWEGIVPLLGRVSVPAGFICQCQITVGQGIFPIQNSVS